MSDRTALVVGVSGQDGAYLSRLLLEKGYRVVGASRDAENRSFDGLSALGIRDDVETVSLRLGVAASLTVFLEDLQPTEIYHLAGQSSVGRSFERPHETWVSNALATVDLLEAMRITGSPARVYVAGSSESFGETGDVPATESHPFAPRSPYGAAKAAAVWATRNYRDAYGLYACCGLTFNHESPLRPVDFVTRKIVRGAVDIAEGRANELVLGRLDIHRDWGYAGDYVEAMWSMLQRSEPQDFVLATGVTHSLADFVAKAFEFCGIDPGSAALRSDPSLFRPHEIVKNGADPALARDLLGWEARTSFDDLVRLMVEAERS